jgi:hypothetical protein
MSFVDSFISDTYDMAVSQNENPKNIRWLQNPAPKGWLKPYNEIFTINWCRISQPSTVFRKLVHQGYSVIKCDVAAWGIPRSACDENR